MVGRGPTPHMKMVRDTGKAIEALAIKCMVDEMMISEDVVITYHDIGSS